MGILSWAANLGTNYVRINLTTGSGLNEKVPYRSGLNWGQRQGRDFNQAYLPIKYSDQSRGFFPDIGVNFQVECDDGVILTLVRAQQNGKALHTPERNSLLGEYFRKRLGVRSGDPVALRHLVEYGRTSVDIFRSQDNFFRLDFRTLIFTASRDGSIDS